MSKKTGGEYIFGEMDSAQDFPSTLPKSQSFLLLILKLAIFGFTLNFKIHFCLSFFYAEDLSVSKK